MSVDGQKTSRPLMTVYPPSHWKVPADGPLSLPWPRDRLQKHCGAGGPVLRAIPR